MTYDAAQYYEDSGLTLTREEPDCSALAQSDRNSALRKQNAESRERNARVAKKSQEISDMIAEKLGEASQ